MPPPDDTGPATPACTNVLGVRVSAVSLTDTVGILFDWIERQHAHYVCVTGVHGVMESWRDPALRDIHNRAGLVTPDGMPLVWLSWAAGHRAVTRVYGPDLMLAACTASVPRGYRHFFYGGAPGIADALAARLRQQCPGLVVAGTWCPPFRALTHDETADVRQRINDAHADIVWVGISTPRQERWMADMVGTVQAPVFIGVGAAFDFHAGAKRQAPRWMQQSGLEWLFRLASEPRRLGKRYLINNPWFLWLIVRQALGMRVGKDEGV
ncbi:MAG: WecB/TagA/CpsF family glycosyltransferase [Acidobacteria bacterium]|nr:WecB/TagA/CpsF family glycosyltransferase [Acidobacteriota bacterium]